LTTPERAIAQTPFGQAKKPTEHCVGVLAIRAHLMDASKGRFGQRDPGEPAMWRARGRMIALNKRSTILDMRILDHSPIDRTGARSNQFAPPLPKISWRVFPLANV